MRLYSSCLRAYRHFMVGYLSPESEAGSGLGATVGSPLPASVAGFPAAVALTTALKRQWIGWHCRMSDRLDHFLDGQHLKHGGPYGK